MHIRRNLLTTTTLITTVALTPVALGQLGNDSPRFYYEDDAWYDISEWFDGNDYNPTDEVVGRWDDEHYDAYEDFGGDVDDDWYGYDADTGNDWFYDYYDDGFAGYGDRDDDGLYEWSYRFVDLDHDGVYDAYWYYEDRNVDGLYDLESAYWFNLDEKNASEAMSPGNRPGHAASARGMTVTGTVARTKKASVHGTHHRIVEIETEHGAKVFADLGPADALGDDASSKLKQGASITVRGPMGDVGDKVLLAARTATVDGRNVAIDRAGRRFSGTVQGVHTTDIRDHQHLIAMVRKDDRNYVVDLGPADAIDDRPTKGMTLACRGVPVRAKDDTIVVFATRFGEKGDMRDVTRHHTSLGINDDASKSSSKDSSSKKDAKSVDGTSKGYDRE